MSLFHASGVKAVWRRQLGSLLGNPLCYIFILAYVLSAAVTLFWPEDFYSRNITDLGAVLPRLMPWLLVALVPALAMNAWSAEREQGTDELLLTLPLSPFDAILGKYLAIISYFTLALICSLTNVAALLWLGSPDLGLICATYLGWWFAGLALAGLGLLASVQVTQPAIAFVIGVVYCGVVVLGAQSVDWFDAFNRGLVPLSGVVSSLAVAAAALAVALLQLGSRRWRPDSAPLITAQVLSLAFAVLIAVNVSRIAQRWYVDTDVSTEGLSSLSAASVQSIRQIENPVTIAVFISQNLPSKLASKAKEVTEKVKALERASGGKVEVKLYRPQDPLDEAGQLASHYGLRPIKAAQESVAGAGETEEIFLSSAVVCAGRSQLIPSFDPGLSVEYELVRAVRGVSRAKKPILGLASTDLKMNGDFNMQTGQMAPAWSLVEEWKKQYEIREVDLGVDVAKDVDVLVVPLASNLGEPQVQHLHDYIWNGRPALLLEDPLPISNPALAPSQPKKPAGGQFGQPPGEGGEKKADLKPLYHALGLDFDYNRIVWSKFNPSHRFRGQLPATFVWVARDQGSIPESPITSGMDLLVLPFPGAISVAKDKAANLTVKPLLTPSTQAPWGLQAYSDWVEQSFMGTRMREPKSFVQSADPVPALAVEITGTMPSAYPRPAPGADKPATDKKDDAKKDEAKKDDKPELKPGVPSPAPVHVIVVADADFANNEFFDIYRSNAGERDEFAELRNLRNVQFLANAVDALAGDSAFLALRTRRPQSRPLTKLEDVVVKTDKYVADQTGVAERKAEDALAKANQAFAESSNKIDSQENLDENSKAQRIAMLGAKAQRTLDAKMRDIDRNKGDTIRLAKIEQRRAISDERRWVRFLAIGFPTLVMLLLVITVSSVRLGRERSHIPAARKRATA